MFISYSIDLFVKTSWGWAEPSSATNKKTKLNQTSYILRTFRVHSVYRDGLSDLSDGDLSDGDFKRRQF